ncbi:hypothetical protein BK133_19260 [Paenibacillus sp. FSL H8-0548]|uniref:hypothetical protein n=1 Tax=Paenibacillus sp. FSL H8-0548 TaxID=1920422 RepID=UPI00096C222E|nr:hypothetical protein [Paenibacillus sp. FSL H8-0548]OMF27596.1 hypothetical protein BK133_19260 [Paenibacillus sp. FSL H8-0548]
MSIVLHEIKKLFGLRMVVLLLAFNVVFYFLFIQFYFQYFPNGRPDLDLHNISIEMKNNYGTHMDDTEYDHFLQNYANTIEETEQFMQSNPQFIAARISTYDAFRSADYEQLKKLKSYVMFELSNGLFWKAQAYSYLIERKENSETRWIYGANGHTPKQQHRIDELLASGESDSVFTFVVFNNYKTLINYMTVLIGLSILFIISPLFLKDKHSRVIHLQYTTRIGRALFRKKLIAALLSSLIIITVQLGTFFLLYSRLGTGIFLDSGISSIFNDSYFWYNLTFGQFIALSIAAMYLFGLITALAAAWISSLAGSFITIIGLQIPYAFLVLGMLPVALVSRLADLYYAQYVQPLAYLLLISGVVLLLALRWRRERRADLLV